MGTNPEAPRAPAFTVDPAHAIPALPRPWHKQSLEDIMLRGVLKETRPARVHIRGFPVRLSSQFRLLGKTADLRKLWTRQRIVAWFGLEIIKALEELHTVLRAQVRGDMEGDAGWNLVNPLRFSYTPVDTRLHLAHQAQIAVSQDTHDELETLANEAGIALSDLCTLSVVAAFSRSQSWVAEPLRTICLSEVELFRHSLLIYAQQLEAHAHTSSMRAEATARGRERRELEEQEEG